ncbi:hypothetical protein ASE63_08535 [Bosea sp. Root381]|uniref:hypothetical protein n=1 Tax=Bosea sp. Root381 TaxID=1736524 RepID=UPI0006F3A174|nr:hypothetical protein [Bosea sp. Root381]KRE00133.1 hypothetical protein ASE63_08535 [Bosea sp. Root381]
MRVVASIAMAGLVALGASQPRAHQAPMGWDYPYHCCSGADCAQIEAEAVRESPYGFVVTILPGEHPMWPTERRKSLTVYVPYDKATASPDGRWHLCINDAGDLLCFFAPSGDS